MSELDEAIREEIAAIQEQDPLEGLDAGAAEGGKASGDDEQYSEAETLARESGWNPEGVEGKRNLSAEEFNDRKGFYDEIHTLKRQLKQTTTIVDALKQHNETVAEKSYERALGELREQKKVAAQDEDLGAVINIDEQIEALKESKVQEAPAVSTNTAEWDTAFDNFQADNIWYGRIPDMTQKADMLGRTFMESAVNATPEECYAYVMRNIKGEYPDEFRSTKQARQKKPQAVAASQSGASPKPRSKKHSLDDLDAASRKVAEVLISTGTITEDKYLKDYFS